MDSEGANVLAFENRGEWWYVADDPIGLLDVADNEGEVGADQCDDCGSFDPASGEPGAGFMIREYEPRKVAAFCGCCDRKRPIHWRACDVVVFPW